MQNKAKIIERYKLNLCNAFAWCYEQAHGKDDKDDKDDFVNRHVAIELQYLGLADKNS